MEFAKCQIGDAAQYYILLFIYVSVGFVTVFNVYKYNNKVYKFLTSYIFKQEL